MLISCFIIRYNVIITFFYRTTNTEKSTDSEVEIQHNTKRISTVKETEAQEDGHDEINVYEDINYEIHGMSSCPAYGTIN